MVSCIEGLPCQAGSFMNPGFHGSYRRIEEPALQPLA